MTRSELDDRMAAIYEKHGAFFAFSTKQFNEQQQPGTSYANCGHGLICPTDNTDSMFAEMDKLIDTYHKSDLEENGKKEIIWRELANHECQISMDYSSAVAAVAGYGITEDEVKAEWRAYFKHCVDNDYF